VRFQHRDRLNAIVADAMRRRGRADLVGSFEGTGVCWGDYNTLHEAIGDPQLISTANPLFAEVRHPSGQTYLTPGAAATLAGSTRDAAVRAPALGEHTDEILASVVGLSDGEISKLHDEGTVASADRPAGK
jgi:2-methylfumaryl-CoA isomerase